MEEKQYSSELNSKIARVKSSLLANPGKMLSRPATGNTQEDDSKISPREAAVCMILKPDPASNELRVLLIKRRERASDPWSGHMAFPGGKYADEEDEQLLSTVIREVLEETSIDLRNCSMLGTLDEILPGNRSVKVTPFVALAPEDIQVRINENEISNYFWIPLSFFGDDKNKSQEEIERMGKKSIFPSYLFQGQHVIWGMTYRIIQDFFFKVYSRESNKMPQQ